MRYRLTRQGGVVSEWGHWDEAVAAYRKYREHYNGALYLSGCATNARGICIGQWVRVKPARYQGEASNNG